MLKALRVAFIQNILSVKVWDIAVKASLRSPDKPWPKLFCHTITPET